MNNFRKIVCSTQINRVKRMDCPECKNCKYFLPDKTFYSEKSQIIFGRCGYFGIKNVLSCEINYAYASICRIEECGQYGKYYSEKKE